MISLKLNMPFYLMAFYGAVMIAAVMLLRALLKDRLPRSVFPALWCVVLLRLLVPFSLSSPLSMQVPDLSWPHSTMNTAEAVAVEEHDAITEEVTISIGQVAETSPDSPVRLNILTVYLAGMAGVAGVLLVQRYSYMKRLKDSLLVEHNETINTILREMGMGHILVSTNDAIASPLVCGLAAPRIYLPTRMDLTDKSLLQHILCHEAMHIRRKDNLVKALMLLAVTLHWFDPLVWMMARYLASDLEGACDEAVLRRYDDDGAKKSYAMSLLSMAITGNRPSLLYSAFAKTEVEKRIQSVLRYRKAPPAVLAFSLLLVLSSSVALATGGQAPFSPYLTSFCVSDGCRWGVRANVTRSVLLGKDAQDRAEQIIFSVLDSRTSNEPEILEDFIIKDLAREFHVDKGAFALDMQLCLSREELLAEYADWGLIPSDSENDAMPMLYEGETIRTFSDKMLGRYIEQPDGSVDINVVRDSSGSITSVTALHEGDKEYDLRTAERGRYIQIRL